MVTCLVFVNGCMFEFIVVTALVNRGSERLGDKVSKLDYSFSVLMIDKVEQISRLLTPLAFGLFNFIYWPLVLTL